MSEEKRQQITAALAGAGVEFSAYYRGESKRGNWQCDEWKAVFTKQSDSIEFDFLTGLGHRKPQRRTRGWSIESLPVAPHAADVLCSTILDASACEMSFRDWCWEYGYNSDSMKDFATYAACCENGEKLRRFFTPEQREQLRAILEDY